MKLASLKLSKSAAKRETGAMAAGPPAPKYPYGLVLHLDADTLGKIGLDDPEVGAAVTIEARGLVTAYRESERQGRDRNCDAEIQITDLAIAKPARSVRDAVEYAEKRSRK